MQYFRSHFGSGDDEFPVYFIEFPSCYNDANSGAYIATGNVRSELGSVPMKLSNSYVVPCSDLWKHKSWWNNIHPYCKPAQARRLADMVLANEYGLDDINYVAGPQVVSVEYASDYQSVTLTYAYTASNLINAGSSSLAGFQVLTSPYNTQTWVAATAQIIKPNKVKVTYPGAIYGVRYDAITEDSFPETVGLANSYGVPAVAFADYRN